MRLKGVVMELEGLARFLFFKEIKIGTDPQEVFKGVNYALLIGAKPRGSGDGAERPFGENGKIFIEQGKGPQWTQRQDDVIVLVVGNPANTNCLIAMSHAPDIPKDRFFAMMRLDQNRALLVCLPKRLKFLSTDVSHVCIWGNHSATQVPDFVNAKIRGKPALDAYKDRKWCEEEFIPQVQKRGAAMIAARGKSSAALAANAAIDSIRSLLVPTPAGDWFSVGLFSEGNPYGVKENLIFSFPCRSQGRWADRDGEAGSLGSLSRS